jgi:cytochrome c2
MALSPVTRRLVLLSLWLLTLFGAFMAGVYAYRHRNQIRAFVQNVQPGRTLQTNLYNLTVVKLSTPGTGRYGAIDAVGDGILLAAGDGRLWYVDAEKTMKQLNLRVPINIAEFESDPYYENTVQRDNFAVKDLVVQDRSGTLRVFASHNHWYPDRDCNVLRVSAIDLTQDELIAGQTGGEWRTVYETSPCRELTLLASGTRGVTLGAGGRLAQLSDTGMLVTVGGFGPESETGPVPSQDSTNSYGKTMLVDLVSGQSRIFTMGHRNPQGLAIASDSAIWLTEHAARGGDELNHLVDGLNYGYPLVSYGTQYETMTWASNPRQGHHDGYEPATLAWVPSIGISQLAVLEGTAFPHWRGDLMVSSLNARSVFRVSIQNGRAIFAEPIPVEHRIRDIVESKNGEIVLKAEDDFLLYLAPLDLDSSDGVPLSPERRGAVLFTQCQGCHTNQQGSASGIGPNLWRVVGRPVAAADDFAYSEALRSVGGRWSPQALRRFLGNPDSVAPGTSMAMPVDYDQEQIADLIAYLQTLR